MIARILARIGAWLGAPTLDDYAAADPGISMPAEPETERDGTIDDLWVRVTRFGDALPVGR
jgi:hypothetical protein